MRPTSFRIDEFFKRDRRYIVPLFQRSYVWEIEKHCKPLWEDIAAKVITLLESRNENPYKIHNHFLGAVVVKQIPRYGRQVSADEIIDGQQRVTTLQIFFIALKDFLVVQDIHQYDLLLRRLTENELLLEKEEERYKVWPTTSDRSIFEFIFNAGSDKAIKSKYPLVKKPRSKKYYPRHKLVEAYLYLYQTIQDFVLGNPFNAEIEDRIHSYTKEDRIQAIIDTLTLHLEIVVIELEEQDDPQIIFETLNYRGEPLLPSDLIRNFVFLHALRQDEKRVIEWYENYWKDYYDPENGTDAFWNGLERQGRLTRPRFDLFIFHYLIYKTEREIPITHLFQEFRDWWSLETRNVETELKQLQFHSRLYKQLVICDQEDRKNIFAQRLRIIDVSTIYPLLLYILGENGDKLLQSEQDKIVTILESYLVRRMICGLTTKNYNKIFLSILRSLKKVENLSYEVVFTVLDGFDGDSVRWPKDDELKQAWLTKPMYSSLGYSKTSMVLRAIESYIRTSKQEQIKVHGHLSIEHIMPQNLDADSWKLHFEPDIDPARRWQIRNQRERIIDTFGNLTLLTIPLNSAMQDSSFEIKRKEIAQQSSLRLNSYFQKYSDNDSWSEEEINKRGLELYEQAKNIWPR